MALRIFEKNCLLVFLFDSVRLFRAQLSSRVDVASLALNSFQTNNHLRIDDLTIVLILSQHSCPFAAFCLLDHVHSIG